MEKQNDYRRADHHRLVARVKAVEDDISALLASLVSVLGTPSRGPAGPSDLLGDDQQG